MEVKLQETKTTRFIERKGGPRELYELVKYNQPDTGSYQQFLYKAGQQLIAAPTLEMRVHVITKDSEHIQFSVKSIDLMDEIHKELGGNAENALQDERSWREFRKSLRRSLRRFN